MKTTYTTTCPKKRGSLLRKVALFVALVCATSFTANAHDDKQEDGNEIFKLGFEARFDYLNQMLDGSKQHDASGFKVRYLNLRMDGTIGSKFSYSWRQRFNKVNSAADFVDNMDWLHLTYQPTANWAISAGKQVVMIGGWEYDRAPIDLYFCSEYWNNVACYQLGVSGTYTTNKGNDKLTLQICHSPYIKSPANIEGKDLYAYNLYWSGSHGCYTALHSLNFSEYSRGKYDVYVVLGNQFKFGNSTVQLDLMNRGVSAKELLFDNFSIMFEFSQMIANRVNIFARATYDKVGDSYERGLFVYPGTEITRVGGGIEYYPLGGKGNRDVRLHLAYAHSFGTNTNFEPNAENIPEFKGTARDNLGYLTVGLTWRIDIMSAIYKIVDKVQSRHNR